jgi:biopolymer transport protein ExbD
MRFHTRKRRSPAVNIVSLIDILAILLIFFIVTTTFKKNPPQLEINLPESKATKTAPAQRTEPLVLAVKSDKEITLGDKPVAIETLAQALRTAAAADPSRPVALQADRTAPFGTIVKVLDALRAAGIKDIPAFTQPETPNP